MPLSTRLKGPPGLAPVASRAATLASGVLPLRLRQRPEASTRVAISLACRGWPAWRRTSRVTSRADSPFGFCLAICWFLLLLVGSWWGRGGDEAVRVRPRVGQAPAAAGKASGAGAGGGALVSCGGACWKR